jgi:hypothetical protein
VARRADSDHWRERPEPEASGTNSAPMARETATLARNARLFGSLCSRDVASGGEPLYGSFDSNPRNEPERCCKVGMSSCWQKTHSPDDAAKTIQPPGAGVIFLGSRGLFQFVGYLYDSESRTETARKLVPVSRMNSSTFKTGGRASGTRQCTGCIS